jgi:hypothetical protein
MVLWDCARGEGHIASRRAGPSEFKVCEVRGAGGGGGNEVEDVEKRRVSLSARTGTVTLKRLHGEGCRTRSAPSPQIATFSYNMVFTPLTTYSTRTVAPRR